MNMLKNARLTPTGREILVMRLEDGEHPADVACANNDNLNGRPGHFHLTFSARA